MARAQRWCFTLNNPTLEDHPPFWFKDEDSYGFQYEQGKEGTFHIQGFVTFKDRKRLTQLKQMTTKAHWEVMKGSLKQNEEYCSKAESKVSEFFSQNLKKEEEGALEKLQRDCHDYDDLFSIYKDNFKLSCRFHTFIQKYHGLRQQPRDHITSCVAIVGPTGTGKTGQIRYNYDINDIYWKPHGQWWDGYKNEKVVIFDEFYSWYSYGDLLRLLDRYPLKVPVKGSFAEFNSDIIYITSNQHWSEWYPNIPNKDALWRRIQVKIDLTYMDKKDAWKGPLLGYGRCCITTNVSQGTKLC